jgi:hypothetical protein
MAVGIEAEKIAKGLNGDDGARDRILFVNDLLKYFATESAETAPCNYPGIALKFL